MKVKCPRCRSYRTESIDEGDIIWYECHKCGKTWERFEEEEIHGDT